MEPFLHSLRRADSIHFLPGLWIGDITVDIAARNYAGFLQDPVGTYTYRTTFDLTGFDISTVSISGQLVADNYIAAIRINGFDIGFQTPGQVGFAFAPFSLPSGHYVSGVNTLEFIVYNTPPNGGNPSGLRVELSGTASTATATITVNANPPAGGTAKGGGTFAVGSQV